MNDQTDINEDMRGILINWMVEIIGGFKLSERSLFLSVALLDKYLQKEKKFSR